MPLSRSITEPSLETGQVSVPQLRPVVNFDYYSITDTCRPSGTDQTTWLRPAHTEHQRQASLLPFLVDAQMGLKEA